MKLYLCEKPSQAQNLAAVLGHPRRTQTHWETDGGRVTWCVGHLLQSAEPEHYNPEWGGRWSLGTLPMVPPAFAYVPTRGMTGRLGEIKKLLRDASTAVISTDAGREGEVIGREVLEYCGWRGTVERLWLQAMDEESVKKALKGLRPGAATYPLFEAGRARGEADWLVGLNMTRALTVTRPRSAGVVSVGRVQSSTLALVVNRDREIEAFRPKDYYELTVTVDTPAGAVKLRHAPAEEKRILDRQVAGTKAAAVTGQPATLNRVTEKKTQAPPKLFALSDLQKRANSLWGWPAARTLEVAQALYETHKATTYPRTDSQYLPEEQLPDVGRIAEKLVALTPFSHLAGAAFKPRASVFNTAKCGEHHAIIPTKVNPPLDAMTENERKAYLLIAAHYLANLLPDYEYEATEITSEIAQTEFKARGRVPQKPGWKAAFSSDSLANEEEETETALPSIPNGTTGKAGLCEVVACKTTPPKRYTEGMLIEDMKSVAKYVTDPARKARLKETSGIGTQATRAEVIETLKKREYVSVKGKQIISTPKARELVTLLEKEMPALVDPGETALWEDELEEVAGGHEPVGKFMAAVKTRVHEYIAIVKRTASPEVLAAAAKMESAPEITVGGTKLRDLGDYYTVSGTAGRLYKGFYGHQITPDEAGALLAGQVLTFRDCTNKTGVPLGDRKVRFNSTKKPYPGFEFAEAAHFAMPPASKPVSSAPNPLAQFMRGSQKR